MCYCTVSKLLSSSQSIMVMWCVWPYYISWNLDGKKYWWKLVHLLKFIPTIKECWILVYRTWHSWDTPSCTLHCVLNSNLELEQLSLSNIKIDNPLQVSEIWYKYEPWLCGVHLLGDDKVLCTLGNFKNLHFISEIICEFVYLCVLCVVMPYKLFISL